MVGDRNSDGTFKKGHKIGMTGKEHSDETKKKIGEANKGNMPWSHNRSLSEETKKKIGDANRGRCHGPMSDDHKKKISDSNKFNVVSSRFKEGHTPWSKGLSLSEQHIRNLSESHTGNTGEKSGNWRGGITPENRLIRSSPKMTEWKKAVLLQDDYTCQACGTRGGDLHAHHIMFFNSFPEGRFLVSNGQALCKGCHGDLHSEVGY